MAVHQANFNKFLDLTTGRCGIFSWRYLLWYRHGKRAITSFDFISR
jgi:hypothetical protein